MVLRFIGIITLCAFSVVAMEQPPTIKQLKTESTVQKIPSLKDIILKKCAQLMFQDHPFKNIDSITAVLHALAESQLPVTVTSLLRQEITEQHKHALAKIFKPMPMLTIERDFNTNVCFFMRNSILLECNAQNKKLWMYDLKSKKSWEHSFEDENNAVEVTSNYVINHQINKKKVIVWDLESKRKVAEIDPQKITQEDILYVSLSPDNSYLIVHYPLDHNCAVLEVFDTKSWQRTCSFDVRHLAQRIVFSPNSSTFAVMGAGKNQSYCSLINYEQKVIVKTLPCSELAYFSDDQVISLIIQKRITHEDITVAQIKLVFFDATNGKFVSSTKLRAMDYAPYFDFLLGRITVSKNKKFCLVALPRTISLLWDLTTGNGQEVFADTFMDCDGTGFFYIENGYGKLIHKNFEGKELPSIPDNDIREAKLSPNGSYLIVETALNSKLYYADTLQHVITFPTNDVMISPLDSYALATEKSGKRAFCYLLNAFDHCQSTWKELLALTLLEFQKLCHKPYGSIAQSVCNITNNFWLQNFAAWRYGTSLVCNVCKKLMKNNELILACGHAQMHTECLQRWRKDYKYDDCPICVSNTLNLYYLALNNDDKYLQ